MKSARPYTQRARAAATEATRARILDAAREAFMTEWYEDVTVPAIARAAGVSAQTVVNHFGGKAELLVAATAAVSSAIEARRDAAAPGDVRGAIDALVDDYEITGDPTIRMLASELRLPALRAQLEVGRAGHRAWIRRTLSPDPALLVPLLVATDVYAWHLLRRDHGLSRDETADAIFSLVSTVLRSPHPPQE